MVKFSSEFREKVVFEFLEGGGTSSSLVKKYGIGSRQTILNWVNQFKKYGGIHSIYVVLSMITMVTLN